VNEIVTASLLKLYGTIASLNKDVNDLLIRGYVESFLEKNFNKNTVKLQLHNFDVELKRYKKQKHLDVEQTIRNVGATVNKELPIKQKYLILIYFLQFVKFWQNNPISIKKHDDNANSAIDYLVDSLKINKQEYIDLKHYINNSFTQIAEKNKVLLVHDNPYLQVRGVRTLKHANLEGDLVFYHVKPINTYILKYRGDSFLRLQNKDLYSNHIYFFDKGSSLKSEKIKPIYYSSVVSCFLSDIEEGRIVLKAIDIDFKFPKSENGIRKFSFEGKSGQMIGIMGGSGAGKSTLLNILNGTIVPNHGTITINGINIHDKNEDLDGIIGYIPQDDLLIEELTVYQNLYYNAKLCLGNLDQVEIDSRITRILSELDLYTIKDLKVGNPLNKFISGGQRKRLNIALELIREPYVLFVDEPTSGLSSSDSERVIELLKEQALSGKFLAINIHQPSSNIYKQLDNILLLDKGGFPIYFGNPIDAIEYVKKEAGMLDFAESVCNCCNNINPELVLEIIEMQKIDDFGEFTKERRFLPVEWYKKFIEKLLPIIDKTNKVTELPKSSFRVPTPLKQFGIFSIRNFLSKIADKQYLFISLFVSPLLALILSFLVRHLETDDNSGLVYVFIENENIPAYIFMSIIVALFIGLIVSAEEIYRDRKILKRESYLNLSQLSYYNSKIVFLFLISAIQTLSYVLIGNFILEVKGMNFNFWLLLFSLSCFSNMVGLNISSAFKSAVTIYIIIPLVLVPQILLGGVIVNFDQLHNSLATKENVPLIGDFMASRWAYEAMMVTQFKDNEYEKEIFDIEKQLSQGSFLMNYTVPKIVNVTKKCIKEKKNNVDASSLTELNYKLLRNEINKIQGTFDYDIFKAEDISVNTTLVDLQSIVGNLVSFKRQLSRYVRELTRQKDNMIANNPEMLSLKNKNYNNRISDFVLRSQDLDRIVRYEDKLIQRFEPIFLSPSSKIGRSHFFSSYKNIGGLKIDTLWFNTIAIWLMTLVMYMLLYFNVLKKIVQGKFVNLI